MPTCLRNSVLAALASLLIVVPVGCGSSDDAPALFAQENDAGIGGSKNEDGGTDEDGGDKVYDGTCETAADCDDGIPCTVDSCAFGACRHVPGPNEGATACGAGQHCEVGKGCVAGIVCSDDEFCQERFADDPCKTNVRCSPATAVCEFSILDADGDGIRRSSAEEATATTRIRSSSPAGPRPVTARTTTATARPTRTRSARAGLFAKKAYVPARRRTCATASASITRPTPPTAGAAGTRARPTNRARAVSASPVVRRASPPRSS